MGRRAPRDWQRRAVLSAVLMRAPGRGGEAATEALHRRVAGCRRSCRQQPGLSLTAAARVGTRGGGGARNLRGPGRGSSGPQTPAPARGQRLRSRLARWPRLSCPPFPLVRAPGARRFLPRPPGTPRAGAERGGTVLGRDAPACGGRQPSPSSGAPGCGLFTFPALLPQRLPLRGPGFLFSLFSPYLSLWPSPQAYINVPSSPPSLLFTALNRISWRQMLKTAGNYFLSLRMCPLLILSKTLGSLLSGSIRIEASLSVLLLFALAPPLTLSSLL